VPVLLLAEMVNIGTLFAFLFVAVGVLVLRRTRPDLDRGFRLDGHRVQDCAERPLTIRIFRRDLPSARWSRATG